MQYQVCDIGVCKGMSPDLCCALSSRLFSTAMPCDLPSMPSVSLRQSASCPCSIPNTLDKIINQSNSLGRFLRMYPMSSLKYFQPHIREKPSRNGYIIFIQIPRMFTFHKHRRTIPSDARGGIWEIADMWYSVVEEVEWYTECKVTRG
jgi:hypothetical protein